MDNVITCMIRHVEPYGNRSSITNSCSILVEINMNNRTCRFSKPFDLSTKQIEWVSMTNMFNNDLIAINLNKPEPYSEVENYNRPCFGCEYFKIQNGKLLSGKHRTGEFKEEKFDYNGDSFFGFYRYQSEYYLIGLNTISYTHYNDDIDYWVTYSYEHYMPREIKNIRLTDLEQDKSSVVDLDKPLITIDTRYIWLNEYLHVWLEPDILKPYGACGGEIIYVNIAEQYYICQDQTMDSIISKNGSKDYVYYVVEYNDEKEEVVYQKLKQSTYREIHWIDEMNRPYGFEFNRLKQ